MRDCSYSLVGDRLLCDIAVIERTASGVSLGLPAIPIMDSSLKFLCDVLCTYQTMMPKHTYVCTSITSVQCNVRIMIRPVCMGLGLIH